MRVSLSLLAFASAMFLSGAVCAQQAYPSPEAAADALVTALEARDVAPQGIENALGPQWQDYVPRDSVDRQDVDAFIATYHKQHDFKATDSTHAMLSVGDDPWTFPVPLVKKDAGWAFDLSAAEPELRARRIGRHERDVVQAAMAYEDAQLEYADKDRDGDGKLEYATKFRSTEGKHDGLYWEDTGSDESPLGSEFGGESHEGEWYGYHYRILTGQGASAPRGAYSYMVGEDMVRGFAMVAWPARYGDSGVMTYMISHAGEVFEKDMGPDTDRIATDMSTFDPDSSWSKAAEPTDTGIQ